MIQQKVWVEINKKNLEHNLNQFRQRIGDTVKLACVLKSNAYGHGLDVVAKISQPYADFFAVDSINEALALREQGIEKSILILGYTLLDNLDLVIKNNFHQTVSSIKTLKRMSDLCIKLKQHANVHLKIETGTARQGIFIKDLSKYLEIIKNNQYLKLSGISTHYANIEDTTDHTYAFSQLKKYKQAINIIEQNNCSGFLKHTACSAAAVLYPQTYFDLIRLGISMYGLWSSTETLAVAKQKGINIELKPVLTWKTKIAQLKVLKPGSSISYGCTEKVEAKTKIAILPIGYWDGYDRKLSSVGTVLINGKRCKILGRVCMNMTIIDVNHLTDLKLEDEAVLLGEQNGQQISAEEIAKKINTINYEVVTKINPLIKRIII